MIFFNHLPKTGGLFFQKNWVEPNFKNVTFNGKNIDFLVKTNEHLTRDSFLHYHEWFLDTSFAYKKLNLKEVKKHININFCFSFIRDPIDIFYSSFYWCKDESAVANFSYKTNDGVIIVNINDVNSPHALIDILYKHQEKLIFSEFFINKIFQNTNFYEYNIIFDYKYYASNVDFLINQFKLTKSADIKEYKNISMSYGKSKNVDKKYKIEFLRQLLSPSIEIYKNLQNIIFKPSELKFI